MNRTESVASEAAVLVGVLLAGPEVHGDPLEELEGLAATAGARVVGQLTQRRAGARRDHLSGQGQGRGAEAAGGRRRRRRGHLRQRSQPRPRRAIWKRPSGVKVLDRTRADSRHLRQPRADATRPGWPSSWRSLQYALPRLKRMWTHLSRQKKGIGLRGPGEKQLEDDRRLVEKRINDLRGELQADRAPQGARGRRAAATA